MPISNQTKYFFFATTKKSELMGFWGFGVLGFWGSVGEHGPVKGFGCCCQGLLRGCGRPGSAGGVVDGAWVAAEVSRRDRCKSCSVDFVDAVLVRLLVGGGGWSR